jgi:hypothetical protein
MQLVFIIHGSIDSQQLSPSGSRRRPKLYSSSREDGLLPAAGEGGKMNFTSAITWKGD